jgi:RecA-family ATPase
MTLSELGDLILKTSKKSKDRLPWLKLATFGNKRTVKNCLRHNGNVLEIRGVEADYDAGKIGFDDAVEIARKAGLKALLYTSASYTDAAPKWRIVLPTSRPLPPGEREKLVARVNGLYGGIFDGASFTLSQSYYFGAVGHNPAHRVEVVAGDFIDQRDDLDAGAIYKNKKSANGASKPAGAPERDWVESYLDETSLRWEVWHKLFNAVITSKTFHTALVTLAAKLVTSGMQGGAAVNLLKASMQLAQPHDARWKARFNDIERIVGDAEKKFGQQAQQEAQQQETSAGFGIVAKPYEFPKQESIPRREFVYGSHLLRSTVSLTAAQGATGKSSKAIVEALAMTSGRDLLDEGIPPRPLRVLLLNLEDNRKEMDRRIAAAMTVYDLRKEDIGERLIVIAKGEMKLKIAGMVKGQVRANTGVTDAVIKYVRENNIDVVSVDPLRKTHSVNENGNTEMGEMLEEWEKVAEEGNCAVHLWHHTRKGNGGETTLDSARGASVLVDGPRSVRVMEPMSKQEEDQQEIQPGRRRRYVKTYNGKLNFAPATDEVDWFEIVNVDLLNGDPVGVVKSWTPPPAKVLLTPEIIAAIKVEIGKGGWREDQRAAMWVGKAIATVLGIDPVEKQTIIKGTLRELISSKVLTTFMGEDEHRKQRLFVVVK